MFAELPAILRGDELVVLNNTRVIPARLFGRRAGVHSDDHRKPHEGALTGRVEMLLTRQIDGETGRPWCGPAERCAPANEYCSAAGELEAEIVSRGELGARTLRFVSHEGSSVREQIERLGHIPLPPYIDRADEADDRERYQTVFAKEAGAIAAPRRGCTSRQRC